MGGGAFPAVLIFVLGTLAAQAQTYVWNGDGGDGNWSDSSNWVGGIVPDGSNADVQFTGAGGTINVDGSYTVGTLDLSTATSSYTLNISGSLTASGVDEGSSSPNINVVNGGSFDETGASFSAGSLTVSAASSLILSAGATFSAGSITVDNSGTLSLGTDTTLSGATVELDTGSNLSINGGSILDAGTIDVGSSLNLTLGNASTFGLSGTYELLDWNAGTLSSSQLVDTSDFGILQFSGDELSVEFVPEPPAALLLALGLAVLAVLCRYPGGRRSACLPGRE